MPKGSSRGKSKSRVHVISRSGAWAIKKEGASRATKIYKNKDSAVNNAKKSSPKGGDVIVHKKDGSIQKWISK